MQLAGVQVVLALVHGTPILATMAIIAVAHTPLAMVGGSLLFASVSIAYARLARDAMWAREHIFDLWAMIAVMTAPMLWVGHQMAHGAVVAAPPAGDAHVATITVMEIAIVGCWLLTRLIILAKVRDRTAAALVSGILCGIGLVWMALL